MEELPDDARISKSWHVPICRLLCHQLLCLDILEPNLSSRSGICELLLDISALLLTVAFKWNFILLFWTFAQELYFLLGPSISEPSSVAFSSWLFTDPASPSRVGLLAFLWPYRVAYQHITFLKSLSLLISSAIYQVIPQLFPTSTEKIDQVHLAKFFSLLNSAARDMDQKSKSPCLLVCPSMNDGFTRSVRDHPDGVACVPRRGHRRAAIRRQLREHIAMRPRRARDGAGHVRAGKRVTGECAAQRAERAAEKGDRASGPRKESARGCAAASRHEGGLSPKGPDAAHAPSAAGRVELAVAADVRARAVDVVGIGLLVAVAVVCMICGRVSLTA